ncbi:PIN domain-containing protein [Streptomyces sp. NBC_00191]|uniref:PIN domain-containing protein n=1 Tax=Streptomyces sp. NBC_00191 TaxID=2975674 RepID=UPI00324D3712
MLALLDTTAFVADPLCSGTAWRVLAQAAPTWGIRILVPEVVVAEAIGGYQRRTAEALTGLDRWRSKHVHALGLDEIYDQTKTEIERIAVEYASQLSRLIEDLRAEIIAPPVVPHMQLVQRAVSRRRPCDKSGDGYRDTLNWLTLLSIAAKNEDEEIFWISDNSVDFANDLEDGLHEDLQSELVEIGAAGRVRWVKSISDLVFEMATRRFSDLGPDMQEIQNRLHEESLTKFAETGVLSAVIERRLTARLCGFPVQTTSATVVAVRSPSRVELSVKGSTGKDEAVVEFKADAETTALLAFPLGFDISDLDFEVESISDSAIHARATKVLTYSGIIRTDSFGRPIDGEVTSISTHSADPGLEQWRKARNSEETYRIPLSTLSPDLFKALRGPVIPPDFFKTLRAPVIPPDIFKTLRAPVIPPDIFKTLRAPVIPPDIFKTLRAPVIPPDIFKTLRAPVIPPDIFKTLRAPVIPPDIFKTVRTPVIPPFVPKNLGLGAQFDAPSAPHPSVDESDSNDAGDQPALDDDARDAGDETDSIA